MLLNSLLDNQLEALVSIISRNHEISDSNKKVCLHILFDDKSLDQLFSTDKVTHEIVHLKNIKELDQLRGRRADFIYIHDRGLIAKIDVKEVRKTYETESFDV